MADLFVSYSRKDKEFVRRLVDGLGEIEKDVWVDWEDIAPTADWQAEIDAGIDASDSFAFVITPDSLTSRVCERELRHALGHGKRIVPLLHRDPDGADVPADIAARNWIFFREDDDFDTSFATLVRALDTDLEWVHAHTRLLVRAREWEARGRDGSLLLRGADLRAAEERLAHAGAEVEPQPTPLQREYVLEGRRAEGRRQRTRLAAVAVALAVTAILALLAWVQRARAIDNERTAQSRELATASEGVLERDPELSAVLAREAVARKRTVEAEEALRRALSQSQPIATTDRSGDWITGAAFSADGRRILTWGRDGLAHVADAGTGRTLVTIRGHHGRVSWGAFSPNGLSILT